MPYDVFKVEDEFCVYKLDADDERTGDTLGCHPTEDEAAEQVKALYAAEELGEAATLKKQAQRLLKDAEAVMGNKRLPAGVGKAIKDLRSALRRNWADLAVDADDEKAADEADPVQSEAEEEPMDEAAIRAEVVTGLGELGAIVYRLASLFPKEQEAEPIEAAESVALGESDVGAVLALHESEDIEGRISPLQMDVVVIEPGWGNQKDNHYFSRELLQKYAHVFNGAKMYATNHNPEEKNVLTEVSQVLACPAAFTDDGAPIARVGVFDETFAQNIRNRAALGKLESLNVSIQATGKAKSFELDGRKGKTVVEIDPEGANVDWVTRAGAGGHALRLAESEEEQDMPDEEQKDEQVEEATVEEVAIEEQQDESEAEGAEQEPVEETESAALGADVVKTLLAESNLPDASRARLAEENWPDEDALTEAVEAEVVYVAQLTGAGRPVGQEQLAEQTEEKDTNQQFKEACDEIDKRYGLYRGD